MDTTTSGPSICQGIPTCTIHTQIKMTEKGTGETIGIQVSRINMIANSKLPPELMKDDLHMQATIPPNIFLKNHDQEMGSTA